MEVQRLAHERPHLLALAAIAVAALALRASNFGEPFAHLDEQFYLLVGKQMLLGSIPYVDIWDRKPIGLFLLYAGAARLGGDGILQYQLLATGFAIATAIVIYAFACRTAGRFGALLAAIAYLLWLNLAGGEGGQSPVFYNLPVALAAFLVVRLIAAPNLSATRLRLQGCAAVLLIGLALQIKYTALFEGIFFGLALLWIRRRHAKGPGIVGDLVLWAGCALAPTALAGLAFHRIGHFDAWTFANFLSIGGRGGPRLAESLPRLAVLCAIVLPLAAFAVGERRWGVAVREPRERLERNFAKAWLAVAVGAVAAFGTYFDHYALPILAPAAVAAAPALGAPGRVRLAVLSLFVVALAAGQAVLFAERQKRGDGEVAGRLLAAARGQRNCPYLYDGPPIVYALGGWCLATRYPFPSHLNFRTEHGAVGIDTAAELKRIMALRPDRVITKEPVFRGENMLSREILYRHLGRDYRPIARLPSGKRDYVVYALREGLQPLPNDVRSALLTSKDRAPSSSANSASAR